MVGNPLAGKLHQVPPNDLAPDGKRLVGMFADDADGQKEPTHLKFLLNFFDELRRKVPVEK